jgi:3-hydroxy-D-aspartate aldolase
MTALDPGFNVPAKVGDALADVHTPSLIVDLDAFERNLNRLAQAANEMGVKLRPHGKAHKTPAIAHAQIADGAIGICAQKVSEAEAFICAGIKDVTVTNQVTDPAKLRRLAALPKLGAKVSVCVDNADAISWLEAALKDAGTSLGVLVEIDSGGGRCGVSTPDAAIDLARRVMSCSHLNLEGLQAYNGTSQHAADRVTQAHRTVEVTRRYVEAFRVAGLPCNTVTGGGTGTFEIEGRSGVFTELQCGSYALMDDEYGRLTDRAGERLDKSTFENALFVFAQVMSVAKAGHAVCDAGLKASTMEAGMPRVFDRPGVTYIGPSDEHGMLADPHGTLRLNDKLKLVPGHIDPTCNLHDWIVAVRKDRVEAVWSVAARGKGY